MPLQQHSIRMPIVIASCATKVAAVFCAPVVLLYAILRKRIAISGISYKNGAPVHGRSCRKWLRGSTGNEMANWIMQSLGSAYAMLRKSSFIILLWSNDIGLA